MLRATTGGTLIDLRVRPRGRRTALEGERDGRLLVSVTAPPVEGRANDAVCRLIAKSLGVAPGRVTVASGAGGRDKTIRIDGIEPQDVARRLGRGCRP